MGKPLTIQLEDDRRLKSLKKSLGAKSKVDALRQALDTLEERLRANKRMERLAAAARLVARESSKINREFQAGSLLKK